MEARWRASSPPSPGHVQLGGGIRNRESVERWFDLGVSRIVIGTAALKDPEFVKAAARDFPGGIVVAVDARDGFVATEGWAEKSDMPVLDLARRFEDAGVAALLFTDVGRDGMLKGCNVQATVDLAPRVWHPRHRQRRRCGHSRHPYPLTPCAGRDRRRHHRPRAL
jgi:phosphoribosylformimino-5-aminoimidazole carboxamide ribonucleotide (ProFAR) isomerase